MFIFLGTALAGLFGKQVSAKGARVIAISALLFAAIAGFLIWLAIHDRGVRNDALDDQDATINAAVIGADREAEAKQEQRDQTFANSQEQIDAAVSNAVTTAPEQARKPVGPASQSYYDELRRQQKGQ
jgi:hypothetical protein